MSNTRLIARLDIKAPFLIKGINLEGVRKLGDPSEFARAYYAQGIDELFYLDAVASLYGRNSLAGLVAHTVEDVFVPLTVGGGIRTLQDVATLLRSGADKVAINTAAVANPKFITEVSESMGSQCMVLSIDAKRRPDGGWEAYVDGGREHTGLDVIEWAIRGQELGAGEIILTSVDQEGTRKGFDIELCRTVSSAVSIPVIISGGMGTTQDLVDVVQQGRADAVAIADVLHYDRISLAEMRRSADAGGIAVRHPEIAPANILEAS
jgi:imidazole glycerol-phosphate synthase subunit HisF